MKIIPLKGAMLAVVTAVSVSTLAPRSSADAFAEIMRQSESANAAAQASQVRVDQTDAHARTLLREYRATTRQSANLDTYNAHLERQIARQEQSLAAIDASIADITGFQRDLLPLTVRMLDALETFVGLDLPFRLDSRRQRIAGLRAALEDPAVPTADKYHRVLEALRTEIGYGNTVEAYSDRIPLGDREQEATLLRIGRTALFARTDGGDLARWDRASRTWQPLDDDYEAAFEHGLQAARGELPPALLRLPLSAPMEQGK